MSAQAAPLQIMMKAGQSNLEQIARRCWVENGVRYCTRVNNAYEHRCWVF